MHCFHIMMINMICIHFSVWRILLARIDMRKGHNMSDKTILVLGATGRQGGATARHLLEKGVSVRALLRDPQSAGARALAESGIELRLGDMDDRASLDAAVQGAYGVFSVQPFIAPASEIELRWAKNVVEAAEAAGVKHFVYASVQSADEIAKVNGDSTKWKIEKYLRELDVPYTVLRPSMFMDDLVGPRYGVPEGRFAFAGQAHIAIGLIAADDIGAFAALAFENPTDYLGKTIELGGDALTPPQIVAALSRRFNRPIEFVPIPLETVRAQNEVLARTLGYFHGVDYSIDFEALRKLHPRLKALEAWLETQSDLTSDQ